MAYKDMEPWQAVIQTGFPEFFRKLISVLKSLLLL